MRFWKRSIRRDSRSQRDFARARKSVWLRRPQLENLEERTLLSTYTISEHYSLGTPIVSETVDGVTTNYGTSGSPFVFSTASASNTVNILDTSAGIAINESGSGLDTVNIGNGGNVQGILAPVTLQNPPLRNTISIDDHADPTARAVTLSTYSSGGANWGAITGLAPAAINYKYADTTSVSLTTGTGAGIVNVLATGVTTNINDYGNDLVNVGNSGSVQGILAALSLQDTPAANTISIDDHADVLARTVTLSTYSSGGANWGAITGLAPAAINYKYAGTSSVNLTTGTGTGTVNVLATGVTTNINDYGTDQVNVGNSGSVQGILAALSLQDPPSHNTISIDDHADATARTVTLSTYSSGGANWGAITGLAPAAINYKYADTSSVNLTTGTGFGIVNVLATGVPTNINDYGYDQVNVGNSGSVQGILAALSLQDTPDANTISIDDHADATARTVTLSTYSSGGANWGAITGLAPAAINYKYADTSSVNLTTGTGFGTVNVLATGVTTNINDYGYDQVNVGNSGSVQGILAALSLQDPPSHNTISIDDHADATARTVTLSTYSSGGANWGSITGLAPAAINYKYADTTSVSLTTGTGADTVNVLATGVPTNINDYGNDLVNVGNSGSVQGILAALSLQDTPADNTISIDDHADVTARTVTLSTYSSGGANWGSITGLAPAAINYKYADTSSVSLTTGTGADTVNVLATGVTTNINDYGTDPVNVGNSGSVQGILGKLYLQDPPSHNTISIDDHADTTPRTVTQYTYISAGNDWGSILGLAPASINYRYYDTKSVSLTTGTGASTVNVSGTGVPTDIINRGNDSVHVGGSGTVQYIVGMLSIENPLSYNTISIDDSADTTTRAVSLNTISLSGANWGSITGLAPATINYRYLDTTGAVTVATAVGRVTWNVSANAMASASVAEVDDNGFPINTVPSFAPAANAAYAPAPASAPLFNSGGPSYLDVEQGAAADCWLMSSLAEVAARAPHDIVNMFTYDGTIVDQGYTVGLYTVRLYTPGGTQFSTRVDTLLPDGGQDYAHVANDLGTQALWVALAEKAYAQANTLGGVTTGFEFQDNYAALNYGDAAWALQAITGNTVTDQGVALNTLSATLSIPTGLAVACTPKNGSPSPYIVENHCYAVINYNPASNTPYEVFNPWGIDASNWAPGLDNQTYGVFWANGAFLQQNFSGLSSTVGATPERVVTPSIEAPTVSVALAGDHAPPVTEGSISDSRSGHAAHKAVATLRVSAATDSTRPVQPTAIGVDLWLGSDSGDDNETMVRGSRLGTEKG